MSSFPNTISSGGFLADMINHGWVGPWLVGSARYVLLDNQGSSVNMWKSIDAGVTWSVMDLAGSPLQGLSASVLGGTKIYAAGNDETGNPNSPLMLSIFDTVTDTWVSSTTGPNLSAVTGRDITVFYRAFDNKLIIAGTPLTLTIGGNPRTGYILFDVGTLTFSGWTRIGETGVSAQTWECNGILQGVGEVDFLLFSYGAGNAGTRAIWRQPLTDSGVLGVRVQVDTITDAGFTSITPYGFSDGITAVIVWVPTSLSPLAMTAWIGPVSTWGLVSSGLPAPGTEQTVDDVAAVQIGGSTTVFYATTNSGNGNFWTSKNSGSGFGLPVFLGTRAFWNSQPDDLWVNVLGGVAPPWGMVFSNISDGTFYWEAPSPAPPVTPIAIPIAFTVFPFPISFSCCCPDDVACLKPSKNGKMYAFSKGPLKAG